MNGRLVQASVYGIAGTALFLLLASGFLLAIGRPPFVTLVTMAGYAFGDGYSISESLVKATPILLCAFAVILPARLGLISVGGEGQLIWARWPARPSWSPILAGRCSRCCRPCLRSARRAARSGAGLAGVLRARFDVNETISTLLLNYVAVLLVNYAVYGAWKDPASLGWPATIQFPPAATVPSLLGTRVHLGFIVALIAAFVLHVAVTHARWGLE